MRSERIELTVQGQSVALAYSDRPAAKPPLLCLHGFGGSKEDYADLAFVPEFADRRLILVDASGFGASGIDQPDALSIPFLVDCAEALLNGFMARVAERPEFSTRLYLAALRSKVQPRSIEPVFRSMVEISDSEPLLDIIGGLACPRQFIYGAQNSHLGYLGKLPGLGVKPVEIAHSGHFPMYSNPPALWSALATLIAEAEGEVTSGQAPR